MKKNKLLAEIETILFAVTDDVINNNGKVDLAGLEDTARAAIAEAEKQRDEYDELLDALEPFAEHIRNVRVAHILQAKAVFTKYKKN